MKEAPERPCEPENGGFSNIGSCVKQAGRESGEVLPAGILK